MKAADVNAALAQYRAYSTDYAGHVAVPHHKHMALRSGLDVKAVDFSDAALARLLANAEDSSSEQLLLV
jgi:hypothetical protein